MMLTVNMRPKRTRLFESAEEITMNDSVTNPSEDNQSLEASFQEQCPLPIPKEKNETEMKIPPGSFFGDNEGGLSECKAWAGSEVDETRSDASYSIPHSVSESDTTYSYYSAYSETSGPLLAKGNILDLSPITSSDQAEKATDTSAISLSTMDTDGVLSMPKEPSSEDQNLPLLDNRSPAAEEAGIQSIPFEVKPPSSLIEMEADAIPNVLISTEKEGREERSTKENRTPKKFSSVAARLFQTKESYRAGSSADSSSMAGKIDLLLSDYKKLSERLKSLVPAVRTYQEAMGELQKARTDLFGDCDELCEFFTGTGEFVSRGRMHDSTLNSRRTVSDIFSGARKQQEIYTARDEDKFEMQILDYVVEWEDIVSSDISQELVKLKKLEKSNAICVKKAEKLELKLEEARVSSRIKNKYKKAKDSLKASSREVREQQSEVIFLLGQVTSHGYKDLYPLVEATMEWEINRHNDEHDTFGERFPEARDKIKSIFEQVSREENITKRLECDELPKSLFGNSLSVVDILCDKSKPYFFVDDASPYAARVWITLLEKESDPTNPQGFHLMYVFSVLGKNDPGYEVISKLEMTESPVVVHKGNVLSGSTSVAEYIEAVLHPKDKWCSLIPSHPVEEYNMYTFMDLHSRIEALFFEFLECDDEKRVHIFQSLLEILKDIDHDLKKFAGPYLCGFKFTLADVNLFPFIEHIQVVLRQYENRFILPPLESLHNWYTTVAGRPSVKVASSDRTEESMQLGHFFTSKARGEYLSEYHQAYSDGNFIYSA